MIKNPIQLLEDRLNEIEQVESFETENIRLQYVAAINHLKLLFN